jgi:hypothetical protein
VIELEYPKLATGSDSVESYDYITDIPLFNLTEEKIEELNSKYEAKLEEVSIYNESNQEKLRSLIEGVLK